MPLDWSPHPAIPALTKDEMLGMTPERILAYWERREEAIKDGKSDPYRHGFELDTWKRADDVLNRIRRSSLWEVTGQVNRNGRLKG